METDKSSSGDMAKVTYDKCGQCKWLNGQKSSVGIECTNPDKEWRHRTSMYHNRWTKACKMFTPIGKVTIPMKLPSLNEYVNVCRTNPYKASKFKKDLENDIGVFIARLPRFERPVKIHFHWVEGNKRRDLDNIAFAKKFILDAMVKHGKLKDDNRKCVTAFTDTFDYGKETCVILEIEEVENGTETSR